MATAAGFTDLSQIDDSECVQPKNKNKDYELVPDEVRKKVFIVLTYRNSKLIYLYVFIN